MKSLLSSQQTSIEPIGPLLMAVDSSVPSSRMTCLCLVWSPMNLVSLGASKASTASHDRHTAALLTPWVMKASLFAHGRIAAFASRTRGLAQHDVQSSRASFRTTAGFLFLRPDQTPIG